MWNQCLYRQNFTLLTLFLELMTKYKETCCVNTSRKFAELSEPLKLTKLCFNAGFSQNIEKGQFFIRLDDDALDDMKGSCGEFSLPRSEESSRVRAWIRGNTQIGPVLNVKDCYHQGRHGVEVMIESLFRDRTVS